MMGNVGFAGTLPQFGSAVDFAGNFDILLVVAFDAGGEEVPAELVGGVVAVFLEGVDLGGQAAEEGEEAGTFLGSAVSWFRFSGTRRKREMWMAASCRPTSGSWVASVLRRCSVRLS